MSVLRCRELDDDYTDVSSTTTPTGRRSTGRLVAVVVGIDTYDAGIPSLEHAAGDASAVADVLRQDYGFELWGGGPLLNGSANRGALSTVIAESLDLIADCWVFYFAGHGAVLNGQGYLLPSDAHRGDMESYFNLQEQLIAPSITSGCEEVLIILDACYAGQALVRPEGDLSDTIPGGRTADRVRQLISSGNPDQPVLDGGGSGHSVFTKALLDALQGWV